MASASLVSGRPTEIFFDLVRLLFDHGAARQLHQKPRGRGCRLFVFDSVLHEAVRRSTPDVARLLLVRGANLEAVDNDGNTPLSVAFAKDRKSFVDPLLQGGANPNSENDDGNTTSHRDSGKER